MAVRAVTDLMGKTTLPIDVDYCHVFLVVIFGLFDFKEICFDIVF